MSADRRPGLPVSHETLPNEGGLKSPKRWQLTGNAPEQNELLGIRNVQEAFVESFPEFVVLFPRDPSGQISDDKREEAKAFVLEKIGTTAKFRSVVGSSGLNKQAFPNFEGSIRIAIMKSFRPWGIEFEELPIIDKETGRYVDANGASWVGLSTLSRTDKRGSYYFLQSLSGGVVTIRGIDKTGKENVLLNEAEIMAKINASANLPVVDAESGLYIDENGRWVALSTIAQKFGLSELTIKRSYIGDLTPIKGKNRSSQVVDLYNEEQIVKAIEDYASLPGVDKETCEYIDEAGNAWVTLGYFKNSYGLNYRELQQELGEVSTMPGKDQTHRRTILFKKSEALDQLKGALSIPRASKDSGYVDVAGESWVSFKSLGRSLKISDSVLKRVLVNVQTVDGKASNGLDTRLYNEREARELLNAYLSLPKVDKASGYVDDFGNLWVTVYQLKNEYKIAQQTVNDLLKNVPVQSGRASSGVTVIYSKQEAIDQIKQFLSLPFVDKETGKYTDDVGTTWTTFYYFTYPHYKISSKSLAPYVEGLISIYGRSNSGNKIKLFKEEDIRVLIKRLNLDTSGRPRGDKLKNSSLPGLGKSGFYRDKNGETWVSVSSLSKRFKRSGDVIIRNLPNVRQIEGRDSNYRVINLYNEVEALGKLGDSSASNENLPRVDRGSDVYVDESGDGWVTANYFRKAFNLTSRDTLNLFGNVPSIDGRDGTGKRVVLYKLQDAIEVLSPALNQRDLPQVDKDSNVYIDGNGIAWVNTNELTKRYKVGFSFVSHLAEGVTFIHGRGKTGATVVLYNQEEISRKVEGIIALPAIDEEQQSYVDSSGERWITVSLIREQYRIQFHAIYKLSEKGEIRSLMGRFRSRKVKLFSESEIQRIVQEQANNKSRDTISADEVFGEFFEEART